MPVLETPFAQLNLIRQPEQQNEPLQAFDAADEYMLNHLAEQEMPAGSRVCWFLTTVLVRWRSASSPH